MNGRRSFLAGRVCAPLAVASSLCCMAADAHSAEQRFACPPQLLPDAVQSGRPPAGWLLFMPQEAFLSKAGMLHGAPDESGYLKPAASYGGKNGNLSTWTQRWNFALPHGYETWLYCGYGGGGSPLQLFKRVAADATECIATSKRERSTLVEIVFVCK